MTLEWFPWYPALYRADTMHLTAEQDGIYRRLIDHYMETRQPLPDNDAALARIAGCTSDAFAMAKALVLPFFTAQDGLLFSKKCDEVLAEQDVKTRTRSVVGKKGAESRWKKYQQKQQPDGNCYGEGIAWAMPKHATRQDKTRDIDTKVSIRRGDFFPDWIDPDTWEAYRAMRIKIRKPMTEAAVTLAIRELERLRTQGQDPKAVLEQSIMHSWQGLFELKQHNNKKGKNNDIDEQARELLGRIRSGEYN